MLIEGGIYNDKYHEDICFIYLTKKNNKYYFAVDIPHIAPNQFSKKEIEERVKSLNSLSSLTYWSSDTEEFMNKNANGYLGQINNDLYQFLYKALLKEDIWKYQEDVWKDQ